ncbi:BCNT-C domain-containing protein [Cynara cardunculus var. scolymus]|uniref:BCNT-C domain-containing protein n=1 Tax=Cynara cardunculus var. scolymus TaxID=59895 RepID=A0A103XV37_CYNCS|nr:BCNT-C domain-containing protein [Cynara cardunculus var. scolymus]
MNEEGKGKAVAFSGDQQPQTTTDVPQLMPPLVTNANLQTLPEKNARVDAVWQQMKKGISTEKLNSIIKKSTSNLKGTSSKPSSKSSSSSWMTVLGLGPKKSLPVQSIPSLKPDDRRDSVGEEALKVAAAALSAVKEAASMAAVSGRGKIEVNSLYDIQLLLQLLVFIFVGALSKLVGVSYSSVREVRDFAGESIEVKKLVDANMKEASEKEKGAGGGSAVDAILEQIRKKPKLSVLDKTKKDWGEFKEENRLDEELETYKKSGNQYLDKVSFLQRADYREFERERDARLAVQAKRKSDMRED